VPRWVYVAESLLQAFTDSIEFTTPPQEDEPGEQLGRT
jgi:hypothetical protein